MREVYIDGVCYVPATDAVPNGEAIIRGLAHQWYGDSTGVSLKELSNMMTVVIDEDGNGVTFEKVLSDIMRYTGKEKESET